MRHHRDSGTAETSDIADWWTSLNEVKATDPLSYRAAERRQPEPEYVIENWVRSPAPTPCTSRASASTRCGPRSSSPTKSREPGSTPGGLGTMGFSHPGSHGRQDGPNPTPRSGAIDGDGCFQMDHQELATLRDRGRNRSRWP